jgi:acetylxylan esterase
MFSSFSKALLILTAALGANAAQGSLQQQTGNWGSNPTNVGFFYYRPTGLPANPALIVAMHYCQGTAQAYFTGTQYANLADTNKFIVIYPDAPDSGGCWDVHTTATLTHNGGGDSIAIANMVRYAISNWGVDTSRVYMTGTSSGAMMTNVLAGAYPDIFQAGSAFAGVPYSCFAGPDLWNNACALGQTTKTAQEWVSMHLRVTLMDLR